MHGKIAFPKKIEDVMAKCGAEILRKGRVRLDATHSLLMRKYLNGARLAGDIVWLFLYVDSSPQWRGIELYATTAYIYIYIYINGVFFAFYFQLLDYAEAP